MIIYIHHMKTVTNQPVFRLQRKLVNIKLNKANNNIVGMHRFITTVEPIDPIPMRCLTVSSPSHQFLITRSYIPTHNSSLLCALELYFMTCGHFGNGKNPPIRIIHAYPLLETAAAYSKVKLSSMMSGSVLVDDHNSKKLGPKQQKRPYVETMLD